MELYKVKEGSKVRLLKEAGIPIGSQPEKVGEIYNFRNIDGMYSYCTDSTGRVVHLKAWAEVEVVDT